MEPAKSDQTPAPQPAQASPSAPSSGQYTSNPFHLMMQGWQAVQINLWDYLLPAVIFSGLALIVGIMIVVGITKHSAPGSLFVLGAIVIVAILVAAIVFAAYSALVSLASAKGERMTFKQALSQSPHYAWPYLGAALLGGLATLGGLILLIIPGLIFATWFALSGYIIVNENARPVDSLKRSKALVQGHFLEMWGVFAAFFAISTLLGLIPILGGFISSVFGWILAAGLAVRYLQLKQLKESNTPAGKADGSNWLAIGLLVVALIISGIFGPKKSTNLNTSPSTNTIFTK